MEPSLSNTNKSELLDELRAERALQDKYLKDFCSMTDKLRHLVYGTVPTKIETYEYLESSDGDSNRSLEEEKKLTIFFYKMRCDLEKNLRQIQENPKYLDEVRQFGVIWDNID
ncbi:uncharacterized protein LOC6731333 [Drosophila simulans]|nr:uncharacterized protein LOC6731333 [Drosophila simulans]XP_039149098.1 uncharacterized protein LOC6731333 [Drosophila simulans]XP_039149101.1 uncharacterized protein LOC6731333 [Drosophila simulans]XP_039149108.1 uncharacterized protein LOC6731333 [Drosophila simulans]XP_039149115.1 uncharacterized protein LOC6731333 [Drosophila simulans]XP_044778826.1 uncharacterized protein LOC6731333 [Drosophila simulans]XP_044778828.1 uncharacterized protein LOC6731333 [Drosophila simulans]EDX04074.1 